MAGLPQPPRANSHEAATPDRTSAGHPCQRGRLRRWLLPLTLVPLSLVALALFTAQRVEAEAIRPATSSRAARDESLRGLPLDKLTPEARAKIQKVVHKPTLFRRMPLSLTYGDPAMHQFLIRNPEIVVNIWQLMGVTRVTLQRQDQYSFVASDGMGTAANVELVYGDNETHLYYGRGMYEGPLYPKPITGECVLLLKTGSMAQEDGTHQIVDRLDIYLNVDNVGVDVITKTMQPLVAKSADQNFIETVRFVERIWRTAERHGPAMRNLAAKLDQVSEQRREQFVQVSVAAHAAARSRDSVAPTAHSPTDPARHTPQLRR